MAVKYQIPRGTFDILPEDSYKWQYVTNIFKEIARSFNYREIVTPIFENTELFERSVGNTSDIVQKEMYKFKDKKGREFALRPEGTAPVVRSYVENNLGMKDNSSKLYYLGPMFRYDRPQKGRFRQFYQYGVENIGSDNPFIDAEVIALGYIYLIRLGLKNFELEINSIGCANCTKDYDKVLVEYFTPFKKELCPDCRERINKKPKRLLDCKVPTCKKIAQNSPSMLDYLDEDCKEHFAKVQQNLKTLGIPFIINPKIVRGLDYYNKTAFEFIDKNLGAQDTLIGGGRYNELIKQFGGKDVPGIGFAGGFERLILSMEMEGVSFGKEQNPDIYFVVLGEKAKYVAGKLLLDLRSAGISVEFDPDKESIKAQMKAADRSKSRFALILGENELAQKKITLKDMESGEQQLIGLEKIVKSLKKMCKK
ncbi:MAG: histidine--tRNA ligase [Candidatus Cloacimonetes bacterium]|nr:histidine--tRNA ligase [Candidatus Cloacimonadota bacterium]